MSDTINFTDLKSQFEKAVPINSISEKYKPLNFTEMKSIIPTPIEYIFYPCLPTQGIGFIYAASGLGKTLFTMNLSYMIASGGNFLKYKCPKPRKVLYIDAEMAFNQLHQRLMLIEKDHGTLLFPDNLHFLTPDKVYPERLLDIDTREGQQLYMDLIEKNNYEVIVFDNLSMLSSIDLNKSNEWKIIQDWLSILRAKGKSTIVVHHSGKDTKGYNGTSRMLINADFAISLQAINEDKIEDNNNTAKKFKIDYQKTRNFSGSEAMSYEVTLENGKWSYQSMENCVLTKIVECHKSKMSQRDIAKELNISQTTVNRLVKKARHFKMIQD